MPASTLTLQDRFWAKVHFGEPGECWLWTGSLSKNGYGRIAPVSPERAPLYAHRLAYEWAKGLIPDGLTIDHLCRVHSCVNAEHLEAVTQRENVLRGVSLQAQYARRTHCSRGHVYDLADTRYRQARLCRRCRAIWDRQYRSRKANL